MIKDAIRQLLYELANEYEEALENERLYSLGLKERPKTIGFKEFLDKEKEQKDD